MSTKTKTKKGQKIKLGKGSSVTGSYITDDQNNNKKHKNKASHKINKHNQKQHRQYTNSNNREMKPNYCGYDESIASSDKDQYRLDDEHDEYMGDEGYPYEDNNYPNQRPFVKERSGNVSNMNDKNDHQGDEGADFDGVSRKHDHQVQGTRSRHSISPRRSGGAGKSSHYNYMYDDDEEEGNNANDTFIKPVSNELDTNEMNEARNGRTIHMSSDNGVGVRGSHAANHSQTHTQRQRSSKVEYQNMNSDSNKYQFRSMTQKSGGRSNITPPKHQSNLNKSSMANRHSHSNTSVHNQSNHENTGSSHRNHRGGTYGRSHKSGLASANMGVTSSQKMHQQQQQRQQQQRQGSRVQSDKISGRNQNNNEEEMVKDKFGNVYFPRAHGNRNMFSESSSGIKNARASHSQQQHNFDSKENNDNRNGYSSNIFQNSEYLDENDMKTFQKSDKIASDTLAKFGMNANGNGDGSMFENNHNRAQLNEHDRLLHEKKILDKKLQNLVACGRLRRALVARESRNDGIERIVNDRNYRRNAILGALSAYINEFDCNLLESIESINHATNFDIIVSCYIFNENRDACRDFLRNPNGKYQNMDFTSIASNMASLSKEIDVKVAHYRQTVQFLIKCYSYDFQQGFDKREIEHIMKELIKDIHQTKQNPYLLTNFVMEANGDIAAFRQSLCSLSQQDIYGIEDKMYEAILNDNRLLRIAIDNLLDIKNSNDSNINLSYGQVLSIMLLANYDETQTHSIIFGSYRLPPILGQICHRTAAEIDRRIAQYGIAKFVRKLAALNQTTHSNDDHGDSSMNSKAKQTDVDSDIDIDVDFARRANGGGGNLDSDMTGGRRKRGGDEDEDDNDIEFD